MTGWKQRFAGVGVGAAMVAGMLGASATPSSAVGVKRPMAVVARDFQFIVPPALPAGQYDLQFINISRDEFHEFVALNVEGCKSKLPTVDSAKRMLERIGEAAFAEVGPNATEEEFSAALDKFTRVECPGVVPEGEAFAPPGQRSRADYNFTPGKTLYFCGVPDDNGTPHFDLGMIGFMNIFSLPTGR